MHFMGLLGFVPETKEEDITRESITKEIESIMDKYHFECNKEKIIYNEEVDNEWDNLKNTDLMIVVFPNGTKTIMSEIYKVYKNISYINGKFKELRNGRYIQTRKSRKIRLQKETIIKFYKNKDNFAINYLYLDKDEDGNYYQMENPYAECDGYDIGGRWTDFLLVDKNSKSKDFYHMSLINKFFSNLFNKHYLEERIHCGVVNDTNKVAVDVARKSDIDFNLHKITEDNVCMPIFITRDQWIDRDYYEDDYNKYVMNKINEFPDNAYFAVIDIHQ